MPLLFSYGTLQQEDVQWSTFGRLLEGQRDELPGFEPSVSATREHANVLFNGWADSRVAGTVFEITDAELAAADEYEQRAKYARIAVTLARPAGRGRTSISIVLRTLSVIATRRSRQLRSSNGCGRHGRPSRRAVSRRRLTRSPHDRVAGSGQIVGTAGGPYGTYSAVSRARGRQAWVTAMGSIAASAGP